MQKLVNEFRANPNDANRAKLEKNARKHPMSVCFLNPADVAFLKAHGIVL